MTPVLLDSSALVPNILRDTLLTLAEHELFEPLWSSAILAEVRRTVIAKRSVSASAIDRTLALMSATFDYAVVDGWDSSSTSFTCPTRMIDTCSPQPSPAEPGQS